MKQILIFLICLIVIAAIVFTGYHVYRYTIESDKLFPFQISKISIVSTAEGKNAEEQTANVWNFHLMQTNDIYLDVVRNDNYEHSEKIKKVTIQNCKVLTAPEKGTVVVPKTQEFEFDPESERIEVQFLNTEIAGFVSDEAEIIHDGKMLAAARSYNGADEIYGIV